MINIYTEFDTFISKHMHGKCVKINKSQTFFFRRMTIKKICITLRNQKQQVIVYFPRWGTIIFICKNVYIFKTNIHLFY